jgi:hypothetical protein
VELGADLVHRRNAPNLNQLVDEEGLQTGASRLTRSEENDVGHAVAWDDNLQGMRGDLTAKAVGLGSKACTPNADGDER